MTSPTTRETADHAELARRAEDKANAHIRNLRLAASRDFAVSGYSDGLIVEQDMRGMLLAAAEAFDALLSEIAALRVDRDEWRNWYRKASVEINEQTDRATQAERQRDELRKALSEIMPAVEAYMMTGEPMAQTLKKRTWKSVMDRAYRLTHQGAE